MATLRLLDDPAGRTFDLALEFTIGRAPGNSLELPKDTEVSRNHARINHAEAVYTLTDLGSSNGTLVERSGRRWQVAPEIALRAGDVILIGSVRLSFEAGTVTQFGMENAGRTMVGRVIPPIRAED